MKFQNLIENYSFQENGYLYLKDLLIQWGKSTTATYDNQVVKITFPKTYKKVFYAGKTTIGKYSGLPPGTYVNINELTTTYFTATITNKQDMKYFYWFSLGI